MSETRPLADTSSHSPALVRDVTDQEITTTDSRHLRRPRDFLAAARFMVRAGAHPQAGRTTLRLAEAFAARMTRSKDGHFPFSVLTTAHELGLSRRAVLNHARYLRELGLIAYVEHGSKTNSLRTRHGTAWTSELGYRGTATLFAAVAPPAWDHAKGRRTDRRGYGARVIGVTDEGRTHTVNDARRTAKRKTSCTPSLVVPQDHQHLKVEGSSNYTSRKRATSRKTTPATTNRPRLSPTECAHNISLARKLRHDIWWLRGCVRRLAYALRPLIAAGWTREDLTSELLTWGVPGRLRDPAAYISHELDRRRRLGQLAGAPVDHMPDDQVDTTGNRYRTMLQRRAERNAPTWEHYAGQLRSELRRQLAQKRRQVDLRPHTEYRPVLREPREDFAPALPQQGRLPGAEPREPYSAYVLGGSVNKIPAVDEEVLGWLKRLNEQREAARACAVLAAELDDWEYERGLR
ncbi:hypothetical protein ACFTTN_31710 [Streptomyces niveus]|uniref:hypothetical protein n=1 Tax=Streptomyces niveus TaxID=193462 RepID=UPI00363CBA1B